MQALEMEKHRVDLSKRGCVMSSINGRWSCSYGTHGMAAVAHNYYTKRGAFIKLYDIYHNGVYECTFDTKKVAMGYLESREKGFEMQESKSTLKDRVKAVIELNEQMHADIVDFLKQHNIEDFPTVIYIKDGIIVNKAVGSYPFPVYLRWINMYF